ncbi:hypothetical protein PHJA_001150200 [Phtheirospermum japonicum]|uniref:DDE Tnp4 domain-containing protein n=1 Tax=Phtheirospermum japonicum TaxID=374723 RepID=A0A830C117_9LAMI|nr:hypothetical protein PHJA_001150200 [Phtheirospermum japonicum]
MAPEYIRAPDFDVVPEWIQKNPKLFPYFKDCVGAIDGTIIPAWVPHQKHGTYRSRKRTLSQNVMAACDFNLNFTFVLSGWEGSANDARVLAEALVLPSNNFPWPPQGKNLGFVLECCYTK